MRNKKIDNAKVGLFVIAGLAFLVLTLYMIGKNRNLFGSTFNIAVNMANVAGLVPGNNVRFKGIDVGTVKSITVVSDTTIRVVMTIDKSMMPYLKKNAVASIGTDGLMGNRLVNINSSSHAGPNVEENDIIESLKPIETDEMLRTLNITNQNIEKLSANLYEISTKLNSSESLWSLLSDSTISKDLKGAVHNFRKAGAQVETFTTTANHFATRLDQGDGIANKLFTDTLLAGELSRSIRGIGASAISARKMVNDLNQIVDGLKQGNGTAGLILYDSAMRKSLLNSTENIEQGTARFNQNMEALKSNVLFRKYFRKMEKETRVANESNIQ